MKAIELAYLMICINAGIYIVGSIGAFGSLSDIGGVFPLLSRFTDPIVVVSGVAMRGIDAIAIGLALGTVVVVNTNAINDRGIAYLVFAAVFWGSFLIAGPVIGNIDYPGVQLFYGVFFLIAVLAFVGTFVQMPTGGQKSYV